MDDENISKSAVYGVVERIIDDLAGRAGLDHEWYKIDKETQEEIREEWRKIVREEFIAGLSASLKALSKPAASPEEE